MTNEEQKAELPPLIDLPVYRDTYLSQERTDELCRYVWALYPDSVRVIAGEIARNALERGKIPKAMDNLSCYLREDEAAGKIGQISLTAMVDLMHEIDRRIHKALGHAEIEVVKYPIAPTPYGPFPPLIDLPVHVLPSTGQPFHGVTQEKADRLTHELYEKLKKEDPEVIFASVELMRMGLVSGEPTWKLFGAAQEIAKTGEGLGAVEIRSELMRRLLKMNVTPPAQENENHLTRD
jgi:hypothetical protein